jgi:hypothetical protein
VNIECENPLRKIPSPAFEFASKNSHLSVNQPVPGSGQAHRICALANHKSATTPIKKGSPTADSRSSPVVC